jgi:hypothetical protein
MVKKKIVVIIHDSGKHGVLTIKINGKIMQLKMA